MVKGAFLLMYLSNDVFVSEKLFKGSIELSNSEVIFTCSAMLVVIMSDEESAGFVIFNLLRKITLRIDIKNEII